jgi:hypothetical protein
VDLPSISTAVPLSLIVVMSGLVYTWTKIYRNVKKGQAEHSAKILQEAKEADAVIRAELEAKIEALSVKFTNLEVNIGKDIVYLKEAHAVELKNIGEKIELLRQELRAQNAGVLDLLSKIVSKK